MFCSSKKRFTFSSIVMLIIISFISESSTIKCYSFLGMDGTSGKAVESPCLASETRCITLRGEDNRGPLLFKGCTSANKVRLGCETTENAEIGGRKVKKANLCSCEGDLCNHSSIIGPSVALSVMIGVGSILMAYHYS